MRVITLTLNPAIDQTITVDRLVRGEVHRARSVRQDAGGKGVNVASCLADWGVPVTALGLLGADNAAAFEALFQRKGIEDRFLRVPGATRVNLKIVDDGDTTDINLDGPQVAPERIDATLAEVEGLAGAGVLIILAGSLPPGCAPESYARLISRLRDKGARILLDTSGLPLRRALEGEVLPHIVKPNRHELGEWCGETLDDMGDVLRAAHGLRARGVERVVVSMGEAGALFLSGEGALVAQLSAASVASTVGAGDAMVAGVAAATVEGLDLERTARLATAFAVAKLGQLGPHLPDPATVHALAKQVNISAPEASGAALAGEAE
jgi:1-phosphofructokinase